MSRITRNHLSRAIAVAGLLTVASLIRPEVGLAQVNNPEQAFLNRTPAATGPTLGFSAYPTPYTGSAVVIEVAAERALLGRQEEPQIWKLELGPTPIATEAAYTAIDGRRALLAKQE